MKEKSININISTRSIQSLLGALILGVFICVQAKYYLLPGFSEIFFLKSETASMYYIGLIWIPIISYILIATEIVLVFNIFKKLKKYSEEGLIKAYYTGGLIFGSIAGLCGLFGGLIPVILDSIFFETKVTHIFVSTTIGITYGITGGLAFALNSGFFSGIRDEVKT